MSTVKLYPPAREGSGVTSPLPQLLKTPSGLAILEIQGSINLPQPTDGEPDVQVGTLEFPDYTAGSQDTSWMSQVYLYIGQHQRLTGEVKKLPKAMAVVRRRENKVVHGSGGPVQEKGDNLEVVEVVKYKLIFSNRPEPVGTANAP